ncbi:hypothetical protein C8Q78DRAFT_203118 [Trametes maxima]|nr:hypothetical protein C8Q78DRAFT_203118 [Trametes maxima]
MSTRVPPESVATIFTQMWRTVSVFSDAFTSTSTRWVEGGLGSPCHGSPQLVQRCARLDAEISQLRKRLNATEATVLPIVRSSDTGGISCEFMFAARDSRRSSTTSLHMLPVRQYVQDVQEVDITDAVFGVVDVDDDPQDHARTESPQVVDPEDGEEAWMAEVVFDADEGDSLIIASPSEDIVLMNEVVPVTDVMVSPVLPDWEEPSEVAWVIAGGIVEVAECIKEVPREDDEHEKESLDVTVSPVVIVGGLQLEVQECFTENEDDEKERITVGEDQQEVLVTEEEEPIEELISPVAISCSGSERTKELVSALGVGLNKGVGAEDFPALIGVLIQRPRDASSLVAAVVEFDVGIADFSIPSLSCDARVQGGAALASSYGLSYRALHPSRQLLLAGMAPGLVSLPRGLSTSPFSLLTVVSVDLAKLYREEGVLFTSASAKLRALCPATVSASPRALGLPSGSSSFKELQLADNADIISTDFPSGDLVVPLDNISAVYDPTVILSPCPVDDFSPSESSASLTFLWSHEPPAYDQVSCLPPDGDGTLFTLIGVLPYLLLGVLFCSMLSSPALCLFFVLWILFGPTTIPPPTISLPGSLS